MPPSPAASQSATCSSAASERCHQGDLWLFDSCGEPEEKLEECGRLGCRNELCEVGQESCSEPEEGRCDGDTVRLCIAGRVQSIDCGAQGLRCVFGEEGAECVPEVPRADRCSGQASSCEGNVLVSCELGAKRRVDCGTLAARCLAAPELGGARCVELKLPNISEAQCPPCGCPTSSGEPERACDGRDENGNGLLDEGLDCGPVDVLAFVVTDAAGATSHAREDIEAEVALVNRLFAGEEEGSAIQFVLRDVLFVADANLLDLDSSEFQRLASDGRLHPARASFYVPMLFTESIGAGGGTPKLGVSTLPNGTCGGVQEGRGPEVGLLAVAKARSETTVAHELGHFLGLCHTHDQQQGGRAVAVQDARTGSLVVCRQGCQGEGDGVCDTPSDPGPNSCLVEGSCEPLCSAPLAPDTRNLMSYYTPCRQHFSAQQRALMQHSLALRRGWHRCLNEMCSCRVGDDSACPVGMSCREYALSNGAHQQLCALDGPRPVGALCETSSQCGARALCVGAGDGAAARCARACTSTTPDCQCARVADDLSVCREDLTKQ